MTLPFPTCPDLHASLDIAPAELSSLLGLVYHGPLESTPWASLLDVLRQRFAASFFTLVLRNPDHQRPGLIVNASVHGPLLPGEPSYSEHYYSICPFIDWPVDQVASADQVLGTEAWLGHEFYRNYLRPLDLRMYWWPTCAPPPACTAPCSPAATTPARISIKRRST